MKYFDLHYTDSKVERLKGESIQDAFKRAGLGGGIMSVVDYWEEITEMPPEQKTIYIDGSEISNPTFINQLREALPITPITGIVEVNFSNRTFEYMLVHQTGTEAFFSRNE